MLQHLLAIASLGLVAIWAFTTSKKRGYSTLISVGWGMLFILILLSRHPILMIGGFIMFSIVSIKHQLKSLRKNSPEPAKQLCSKCGHESQSEICPNCNNHMSVHS